jgi:hypothetical protein
MRALLFLAAAALAAPAIAQSPSAPAAAPVNEISPEALELAKLVEPAGESTTLALNAAKTGFFQVLKGSPDSAAMEAEYPGIYQAVWEAMEPLMRETLTADTPKLWTKLARLYTQRLTPSEIAGLRRFYSTPVGQKMIRAMSQQADLAPIIESASKSTNYTVSAEAFDKTRASGIEAAVDTITPADHAALEDLAQSIPLPKLTALGPDVQRITLAWMNEPDPDLDARIEKVVEERMIRFMAEADKKK